MNQPSSPAASISLESSLQLEFDQLQRKLVNLWKQIGRSDPGGPVGIENTTVLVSSISIDVDVPVAEIQAFEQRFLFLLFLLQQPYKRIIYVTSQPVQQSISDYYLETLPGVITSSARRRLSMICVEDSSAAPLTQKLLDRPHVINHIHSLIPDLAHIVPFNTTDLERRLAVQMGIPMYAADPTIYPSAPRAAAGASLPRRASRILWAGRISFPSRPWSRRLSVCAPKSRPRRS